MADAWWDERYAGTDRVWSGNPNVVLVREVTGLPPARALDLGCGEGADAIWLARQGWTVTGVDISGVALERAARHAEEAGVKVDFQRHDLYESFPDGEFDLVSAQFLHSYGDFPRGAILRRAAQAVAPGGILLIESHLDHGPFGHQAHDHPPVHFATPAEMLEDLCLPEGEWEVLVSEEHDREQNGPDGRPAHRTDSTLKLRRKTR
ncbi:class I SAM-dependent methyltransferase [Actinoplanes sp. NPDC049548]|uniref:class I SAM-dependent methyltransferase n=1 Tax=Actinoplanes sp. NPDC049548 TaxID=3155152 RepID=UPI003431C0A8